MLEGCIFPKVHVLCTLTPGTQNINWGVDYIFLVTEKQTYKINKLVHLIYIAYRTRKKCFERSNLKENTRENV